MLETSKKYFERARKVTPGGVHSPVRAFKNVGGNPRFIDRAEGAFLYDVDGNRFVDFCMSWGPLILGHADPEVAESVRSALSRGWTYGAAEAGSLELAELIVSKIAFVEKIRFVNSGTEAVMSALRLARAATRRDKIVKFDGCYHGHTDSMLVRAGSGLAEMAEPDSAGVTKANAQDTLVVPLNNIEAVREVFAAHGADIAAVIVEAIPANNGLLLQHDDFLPAVAKIARGAGALLIMDEVITGFRIGFGGVATRYGLKPDLVTYGKIIGGGFPVGAFGGRKDIMDLVAPEGPMYQAGTLSANPVAMAAGLTTMKKLLRDDPYQALEAKIKRLAHDLEAAAQLVGKASMNVQFTDSIFWPVFGSDSVVRATDAIPKGQKQVFATIHPALLDKGYYLPPSGYEVGFLATVHTDEHLAGLVEAFTSALRQAAL